MGNHVHLVAVPAREDSLSVLLRRVHGRYACWIRIICVQRWRMWSAMQFGRGWWRARRTAAGRVRWRI